LPGEREVEGFLHTKGKGGSLIEEGVHEKKKVAGPMAAYRGFGESNQTLFGA